MKRKAMYYKKLENLKVICELCPHFCVLDNNKYGKCKTRVNLDGILYTMNYGEVSSIAIDPIEKKPLYNFYPGSKILSIGTYGCNFLCDFCQNHSISQNIVDTKYLSVEDLVSLIVDTDNNLGIAFTYNEPIIWYEYIYDLAKLLKSLYPEKKVVLVSNGFINEKPLRELIKYLDGVNIDLKSFNEDFYKDIGGRLEPVKKSIEILSEIHLEVTTLMVSFKVDEKKDIEGIAKYLNNIDKMIPLHISRYFPRYKYKEEETSLEKMFIARDVAKKYLDYVYLGNITGIDINTYCPKCKSLLIERSGYNIVDLTKDKICISCGYNLNIVR